MRGASPSGCSVRRSAFTGDTPSWVAARERISAAGVWLVIVGNGLWVLASLALLFAVSPTVLGYAFVIGQALIVAVLAEMEYAGLKRTTR